MKILFHADTHIKLGQKNVPKDWALNRYQLFFDKLIEIQDDVDCQIIGGDVFDRVPTLQEVQVFFELVKICTVPTLIYSGNHEAETKKNSFLEYLAESTNKVNPLVRIVTEIEPLSDYFDGVNGYIVPYEFIKKEQTWNSIDFRQPIFTHVRGEIEPHVKSEIPLSWLSKFPVVFSGDLHSHQNTQKNIIYPGSPMTTSFHRSKTKNTNGYLVIDTDDWSWIWKDFGLPQLIRKTVSSKEEMLPSEVDHTIYELEGTMEDLAQVENVELLDKKIVRRHHDVELILSESMDLETQAQEYLTYILGIEDLEEIMAVYYEYNTD